MSTDRQSVLEGWKLVAVLSLTVALLAVASAAMRGFDGNGIAMAIRITARTSFVLFSLAFAAAALHRLWPNAWTRWQRRNRRYLGLSFAASHGVHAVAIASLALVDPQRFQAATTPDMLIFGGVGYLFIAAMAATSFDRSAAAIGPRAWRILHAVGGYYIWISFVNAFGKRAIEAPTYWAFVAILLAVFGLRIVSRWWPARRADPMRAA